MLQLELFLIDSHVPLNKWLLATFLICSSKKGMSSHQLHRMLKVTYKTALFMSHRIRYAMDDKKGKLGGIVEVDETYVGGKEKNKHSNKKLRAGRGGVGKIPVFALVERDGNVKVYAG